MGPLSPFQDAPRRVVILVESPLSERDAARFGSGSFADSGLAVEYWEVAPLTLPQAEHQWTQRASGVQIERMESLDQLADACQGLSARDVVIAIAGVASGEALRCREVLALVSNAPARFCAAIGRAPWDDAYPDIQSRPYEREWGDTQFAYVRLRYSVARALALSSRLVRDSRWLLPKRRRRLGIRPLDVIWVAASSCAIDPLLVDASTQVKVVHSFDYDLIRDVITTPLDDCGGAVFIDGLGPLHPDFTTLELALPQATPEEYFSRMRAAFDWFEQVAGMEVTIAAHPRARPGVLEDAYGHRQVVYGDTAQVVAVSRCVLLNHPSDAVTIVVGLGRPALILESQEDFRYQRDLKSALSRQLGWRRIPVESPPPSIALPLVDVARYESFFRDFIREEKRDVGSFWDVVAQDVRKEVVVHHADD